MTVSFKRSGHIHSFILALFVLLVFSFGTNKLATKWWFISLRVFDPGNDTGFSKIFWDSLGDHIRGCKECLSLLLVTIFELKSNWCVLWWWFRVFTFFRKLSRFASWWQQTYQAWMRRWLPFFPEEGFAFKLKAFSELGSLKDEAALSFLGPLAFHSIIYIYLKMLISRNIFSYISLILIPNYSKKPS